MQPALLGLPHDENSSYLRGPAGAPSRIREALRCDANNTWSETGVNVGAEGFLVDAGDVGAGPTAEAFPAMTAKVEELLERGLAPVALGGDHAVTLPVVTALARRYPDLGVLHFDAHADLYENFDDNPYSHASPFARILERGWVRRLVQVGIRTMNDHHRQQVERYGVEVVEMRRWQAHQVFAFEGPLYISIDMDVLDPAHAPAVSHWEPGGCTVRQLLDALQDCQGRVVGADLVEYNPQRDPDGRTATVAAKILKELLARIAAS